MKPFLPIVSLSLALAGCAPPQPTMPPTEQAWNQQITVQRDNYEKTETIRGGKINRGDSETLDLFPKLV